MDREYLEDYEQKEKAEYERLVLKRIQKGKFDFGKDRYPPDDRFVNLQKPVAVTSYETANVHNLWAQVPFSGSLILILPPFSQSLYEEKLFKASEIPKIVDFIKETGKLQVALNQEPLAYEGLDHLDPFFKEIEPPCCLLTPISAFGSEIQIKKANDTFTTLGRVRFFDLIRNACMRAGFSSRMISILFKRNLHVYTALKIGHYFIVEDVENLIIDDPVQAILLLDICQNFITNPIRELRCDLSNFTLEEIRSAQALPLVYQPQEIRFPCEIGKFLLKKLTYAAQDIRACYELMDHYDAYDLQEVQKSLNEAIVTGHPDIVNKSAEEFSEILDNVWNEPTIPRQIKNLKRGVPISIAAIGSAVSAFTGSLEGFLAGLGISVGAKFLDFEIEGLAEGLVKFFARSYQANVYDFKKKYKGKIARP